MVDLVECTNIEMVAASIHSILHQTLRGILHVLYATGFPKIYVIAMATTTTATTLQLPPPVV